MNYLYIFIYLLVLGVLFSSSVSVYNAEIVARNLYDLHSGEFSSQELTIKSVEIIREESNELIYLFHLIPDGFIMISADDRSIPILAYSFKNLFELERAPPSVSWVLQKYKSNILNKMQSNELATKEVHDKWDKFLYGNGLSRDQNDYAEPLMTAEFDQGLGWNEFCPEGSGSCGGGGRALVGCVAVSMSQIMHYWRYPIHGVDGNTYPDPEGDDESSFGTLSVDFSNSTYDYSAMGDGSFPSEAAALLLYDTGVSVHMDYGCEESGALVSNQSNPSAHRSFENYFKFDDNIASKSRDGGITDDAFIILLKDEIDNNRPVIYSGYDEECCDEPAGHAWNCDGYDEDDRFHMNWGWGGDFNGYFDIISLIVGGNTFSEEQSILYNIQPAALNAPNLLLDSHFSFEKIGDGDNVINPGEIHSLVVSIINKPPWNYASSLELSLTTDEAGIILIDSTSNILSLETLYPGSTFSNVSKPFIINVENDVELGKKELNLMVLSYGLEGADANFFFEEYDVEIEISLNQYGFPYYNASQKTSPLVVDLDNDRDNEIIFGDYNGFIHILNSDGTDIVDDTFPFDTGSQIWGSVAGADMDGDTLIDLAIVSKSKHFYLLDINGLKFDFNADKYLLGTPAIGNLDGDVNLEVVFSGYSSDNMIWALNHDGTAVDGFPIYLGEKVKAGVALADFNENGKDDIVIGTDDNHIYLIYDDGSVAPGFPYTTGDKIQIAPSIVDIDNEKVIFTGCNDDKFYAINSDGTLRFMVETSGDIISPAFLYYNENIYTFFGSMDDSLYAVNGDGIALSGWPISIGGKISKSVVFSDINCDGKPEIIAVTELTDVLAYNLDGSFYAGFPMNDEFTFLTAPTIIDLDNDGDLEILAGSVNSLVALDMKTDGSGIFYWNMYRGNARRTGYSGTSEIGGNNAECPNLSTNVAPYPPDTYMLNSIYPNPFNPRTSISYSMPNAEHVIIEAYDIRGRLVDNIISDFQTIGNYSLIWDASRFPSGVYFISMKTASFRDIRKVLLIK